MKNKKAVVEALFDTAMALLVLFLGIVVMTALTKMNEGEIIREGKTFIGHAIAENNIALYLKQPIEVDDKTLTMADLIVLAAENPDEYREDWKTNTAILFADETVYIKIKDTDLIYDPQDTEGYAKFTINVFLPSHTKSIEVIFGFGGSEWAWLMSSSGV